MIQDWREADEMGQEAVKRTVLAQSQKDDRPLAFPPVQRNVVQYKKVSTHFGEFETTNFQPVLDKKGGGVAITLLFRPFESKVDAKKIALSQSFRATTSTGVAYSMDPDLAIW